MSTTKQHGTAIAPEIVQEFMESARNAAAKGMSQFHTPTKLAGIIGRHLPRVRPVILDLNCGNGSFLHGVANDTTTHLFGVDIDPCSIRVREGLSVTDITS